MTTAAIYCRVSTEAQESEGTSLLTQHESCLKYCLSKGYTVTHQFSESKSGLSLDRPKLDELRDLIRQRAIDVVVVHALDRLSRDPSHGVILMDEHGKYGVKLEAVTETVESSDLGKLINYIRGFASKLEAEKIKERTARGKKARAKEGYMSTGGFSRCFGYDYVNRVGTKAGYRIINETEADIVRDIFNWYANEGISLRAIARRLDNAKIPTKRDGSWRTCNVLRILSNIGYTGKTYAFTTDAKGRGYSRDRSEWIELPSPQIIPVELYETAQRRKGINKTESKRRMKREYLLRRHIRCTQCGRLYYGHGCSDTKDGDRTRRYWCSGKIDRDIDASHKCRNRGWNADNLEALVWDKIEAIIRQPELIIAEIERQRNDVKHLADYEDELKAIDRRLKALDREQAEQFKYAKMGFPEQTIITENKRINAERDRLQKQRADCEANIKASHEAEINQDKITEFLNLIQGRLDNLDFVKKRLILQALDITVWVDGDKVRITGTVGNDFVTTQSALCSHNIPSLPFSLKL